MTTLDTHTTVKYLIAAEIPEKQAEAITYAILEKHDDSATKGDLRELKLELKADIAALRSELHKDIASILKWMIGCFIAIAGLIIPLFFK